MAIAVWTAVCVPAFVIYWRTMAPGVLAEGDTPKFQYLGPILGTAHEPGYPLFIELSWLASKIPIGTLAWRLNFMTMIFGVLAAGLAASVARRVGASPLASILAGLGLAFGPVFWSQATITEVYTLAAALHLATLTLVLRWYQTRKDSHLLAAVAMASLALGHHPTFAMMVPALVVFVLVTDWRVVLKPRVIIGMLILVTLGFAQYLYVVIRTNQHAPYLESYAPSASGLVGLLRGEQFSTGLFAFSIGDLLRTRVPTIGRIVLTELSIVGLILAVLGLARTVRAEWRVALLLAMNAVIIFLFACSYNVPDIQVFVIPVFAMLWILAAYGLTWVTWPVRRAQLRLSLTLATTLLIAASLVAHGYAKNDLSHADADVRYVDAIVGHLETPAIVFFDDDVPLTHAVRYGFIAKGWPMGVARTMTPEETTDPRDFVGRRHVYALQRARALLEPRGLLFALMATPDSGIPDRVFFSAIDVAPCKDVGSREWANLGASEMIGSRVTAWLRQATRNALDPPLHTAGYLFADEHLIDVTFGNPFMPRTRYFDRDTEAGRRELAAALTTDGIAAPPAGRYVTRYEQDLVLGDSGHASGINIFSAHATGALFRFDAALPARVRFCASPVDGRVLFADPSELEAELVAGVSDFPGDGWSAVESHVRFLTDGHAEIRFTLRAPLSLQAAADLVLPQPVPGGRVQLNVNGVALDAQSLEGETGRPVWHIAADALRPGYNEITVIGPVDLGVRSFTLTRTNR